MSQHLDLDGLDGIVRDASLPAVRPPAQPRAQARAPLPVSIPPLAAPRRALADETTERVFAARTRPIDLTTDLDRSTTLEVSKSQLVGVAEVAEPTAPQLAPPPPAVLQPETPPPAAPPPAPLASPSRHGLTLVVGGMGALALAATGLWLLLGEAPPASVAAGEGSEPAPIAALAVPPPEAIVEPLATVPLDEPDPPPHGEPVAKTGALSPAEPAVVEPSAIEATPREVRTLSRVIPAAFRFNAVEPLGLSDAVLARLVEELRGCEGAIVLRGHTCTIGDAAANQEAGLLRATRIRDALEEAGLEGRHFVVESAGAREPIASNKTRRGRRKNRRVTVTCQLATSGAQGEIKW